MVKTHQIRHIQIMFKIDHIYDNQTPPGQHHNKNGTHTPNTPTHKINHTEEKNKNNSGSRTDPYTATKTKSNSYQKGNIYTYLCVIITYIR